MSSTTGLAVLSIKVNVKLPMKGVLPLPTPLITILFNPCFKFKVRPVVVLDPLLVTIFVLLDVSKFPKVSQFV